MPQATELHPQRAAMGPVKTSLHFLPRFHEIAS